MCFTIQQVPGEPVIITTLCDDFDPQRHYSLLWQTLGELLDGKPGPIYRIIDLRQANLTFSALVMGLAEETRSGHPGSASDPRMRGIIVATQELAELIARSFQQEHYGGRAAPVPLFGTLDEALAYVRLETARQMIG